MLKAVLSKICTYCVHLRPFKLYEQAKFTYKYENDIYFEIRMKQI